MLKVSFVCLAGAAMAVAVAVPAMATESESGSKSCGGLTNVATRGNASGVQTHVQNSSVKKFADSGNTVVNRYYSAGYSSASWQVTATGAMNHSLTYAYCAG